MRGQSTIGIPLICLGVLFAACGGESQGGSDNADTRGGASNGAAGSAGDDPPVTPQAGAPAQSEGGAGGDGAAPEPATTEVIDDGDRVDANPALPLGSSGFWWGGGAHLGNWFVSAPAPNAYQRDAVRAEISPPRDQSVWAFRVEDSGRERGIDLWAQLDHPAGRPVDLGAYTGFAFWARHSGDSRQLIVAMNPGVPYFDAPASIPSVELSVSSEWQRFELDFDQFDIDISAVASFDFIAGAGGGAFELWIDDLSLRCRSACDPSDG